MRAHVETACLLCPKPELQYNGFRVQIFTCGGTLHVYIYTSRRSRGSTPNMFPPPFLHAFHPNKSCAPNQELGSGLLERTKTRICIAVTKNDRLLRCDRGKQLTKNDIQSPTRFGPRCCMHCTRPIKTYAGDHELDSELSRVFLASQGLS